jgi:excisionase family DNA binding protein
MKKDPESFLSIKEFASLLKVHQNTIRRAIKSGRIGGFKVGIGKSSVYRIPRSEINRIALFDLEHMVQKIVESRKKD